MLETSSVLPGPAVLPVISSAILNSPLLAQGKGFGLYTGLPDPYTFEALLAEATELYPSAVSQQSWEPDFEEVRGGKPRRSLLTSQAGPIQDAWYVSYHLPRFVSAQLGWTVVPTGNRGSYSYYTRAGDFLDLRLRMRQEFVQRGIEQPDGDRKALHDLEQFDEVRTLHRQQL